MKQYVNIILLQDNKTYADFFAVFGDGLSEFEVLKSIKDKVNKAGNPRKLTEIVCRPTGHVLFHSISTGRSDSVGILSKV